MRTYRNIAERMKGFFDPAIGGALFLIYGAIALLIVNAQRQEEDYQATPSATEQVAPVEAADSNQAQERWAERR